MSYVPNFSSPRTIEGHVINCIFKPFVTRLTASLKFLKSSENVVSVSFILMMCSMLKRFRFILFVCCFFFVKRRCTAMFANYWPTSKMSTVVSSGGCYSVACWIQPHVRNNRKTLRQKTVAISSKITLRGGMFGLGEIQSFLSFARDCLQSTGDDCGGVPPATFFVVDETTSEKNRKGKKNPRYLTFGLGVSFPLKAYRFSV
jgi:hypothetical protein